MIEIKTKLLVITVALTIALLASPFVGTALAGKGQEKLSIRFDIGTYDETTGSGDKAWNSPNKMEYPPPGKVSHFRGGDWGDPATHEGFMIVVDEAGLNIEFNNEDVVYSCTYNANAINMFYGQDALPYVLMNIQVNERWEINNGDYSGYIEITTADRVYDYVNLYEGIHAEGAFTGHGVINGQSVKFSGESFMDLGVPHVYRVGTAMGWPM